MPSFNVIVRERQGGKTEALLAESSARGTVIVCHSKKEAERLKSYAESKGYPIPDPISFFEDSAFRNKRQEYSIDNLDLIIETLLQNKFGKVCSVTMSESYTDSCERLAVYLTKEERQELEAYRALGSVDTIREALMRPVE